MSATSCGAAWPACSAMSQSVSSGRASARYAAQRMVLTGGGSQLAGAGEFAAGLLARPVRIARLQPPPGMPPNCCGPAFSTAIGLIEVALDPAAGVRGDTGRKAPLVLDYLGRVKGWLKESF